MASADAPKPDLVVDWASVKAQLRLERPAKLRSELQRAQTVFDEDQIKDMSVEELIYHVLTLRKTVNQAGTVTSLVKDFKPVAWNPKRSITLEEASQVALPFSEEEGEEDVFGKFQHKHTVKGDVKTASVTSKNPSFETKSETPSETMLMMLQMMKMMQERQELERERQEQERERHEKE